ncbi:MAG: methyltransferase domain-containing protein [Bacteroidales bacterium]|nr:methyltransferase domain-containing protein [Bacteroidales bacterium]
MQQRHKDRRLYFNELADTSREFYINFVEKWIPLNAETKILEIGCGEGGNLLPFAESGCRVTGIDINEYQIENAKLFFKESKREGEFIASDFLLVPRPMTESDRFDIVLVHDVIEHIEAPNKKDFFTHLKHFMRCNAIVFFAFPAWQMPFGGHQQICVRSVPKIPFIHLLPTKLYSTLLTKAGESASTVNELISIKRSRISIEMFERLVKESGMQVQQRILWFINPHYQQKFHLRPIPEVWPFSRIWYVRNFYTTSAWYILNIKPS